MELFYASYWPCFKARAKLKFAYPSAYSPLDCDASGIETCFSSCSRRGTTSQETANTELNLVQFLNFVLILWTFKPNGYYIRRVLPWQQESRLGGASRGQSLRVVALLSVRQSRLGLDQDDDWSLQKRLRHVGRLGFQPSTRV